jgi:hypothetical protein
MMFAKLFMLVVMAVLVVALQVLPVVLVVPAVTMPVVIAMVCVVDRTIITTTGVIDRDKATFGQGRTGGAQAQGQQGRCNEGSDFHDAAPLLLTRILLTRECRLG